MQITTLSIRKINPIIFISQRCLVFHNFDVKKFNIHIFRKEKEKNNIHLKHHVSYKYFAFDIKYPLTKKLLFHNVSLKRVKAHTCRKPLRL